MLNLELIDETIKTANSLDDATSDICDFFLAPYEFDDIAIYDEYHEMLKTIVTPYALNLRN